MQNMILGFFFQSVLICPILMHFEKKKIFKVRVLTWSLFFSKSVIFQSAL